MPLFIVSTPIGNLADITSRASKILGEADLVLAEDTRFSRRLFDHLGISPSVQPYHDFNKERATPRLIEELKAGKQLALITEAGTPGIADPAFYLVRAAIRAQIQVIPVPGPSAVLAALVCSGLPTDRFIFENFLPNKSAQRRKVLESFTGEHRTVIFYETPHRILSTLEDMVAALGDTAVVIGREMTKIHEEFLRGSPRELLEHFTKSTPRGEMVVLFNTRIKPETFSSQASPAGKMDHLPGY
jgi:16S rRNA (cytidine1402-2'-O)-methyltransferase